MRIFFIGLVVLAVVFFGIMGLGGKGNEPPPNETAAADFDPPDVFESLGRLAFYYPGNAFVLPGTPFLVRRGMPVKVKIPPESGGTRLVKLQLVFGAAARVTYACGGGCEKTLCLVRSGSGRPPNCGRPSDRGTILLEPAGGEIQIEASDFRPVRVVSR
jgi:hypothetical protein